MQKLLTLALLGATVQLSHAQSSLKAGTVSLGGGINYTHNGEETSSSNSYSGSYTSNYSNNTLALSPAIGYFATDNLAIGIDLNYSIQETMYKYTPSNSSPTYRDYTSLRLGPFVRYYKLLNDQFGFTGTLGAGYERGSQPSSTTGSSVTVKATGFYAALTPGIIFLPIPKLGIGASIGGLGYSRLNVKSDSNTNSDYSDVASTFGANFGLAQLTFSGTYFFGR